MAIQAQVVPIVFSQGVETKTDSKMTMPGSLTTLENGVFTKGARISKRNGYDLLGEEIIDGASSIGPSEALGVFKPSPNIEELIQVGSNELYSYSKDQSKWIDKDAIHSPIAKYNNIYRNNNDVLNGDVAVNGDLQVYSWIDSTAGKVGASTIDSLNGAKYFTGDLANVHFSGRTHNVSIGSFIYVFYVQATSRILAWKRVSITDPSNFSAATAFGVALDAVISAFDVVSDGTNMWVTYYDGTNIQLVKLDSNGAVVSTASFAKVIDGALAISVNTNVFVYWFNPVNGTEYAAYNSSLASVLAATVIDSNIAQITYGIAAHASSATTQTVFYSNGPAPSTSLDASNQVTRSAIVSTTGITLASSVLVRSVTIASKTFVSDSSVYFYGVHMSDLQSSIFLFRSDGVCIGRMYPGTARRPLIYSLGAVVLLSGKKYLYSPAIITKYNGVLASGQIKSGLCSILIDFDNANSFQNAMLGRNLHFIGAMPSVYDGNSVTEQGFNLFPENYTGVASLGGLMGSGVYQYSVVYEWVDNTGQVHRSAAGVPIEVTVVSPGQVTLTIPTLRITEKSGAAGSVIIQIYRTKAGETVFFNVKSPVDPVLYNDLTVDSVSYVDQANDITISTNEILYTTGDVLDNDPSPSCSMLDVYQNRMVISGLEDPLEFAYSKTQVKGEGVAFSGFFTSRIDPFGGDISAIKLMDDKVILFKENSIFFVSGEGPNDTGSQNNYTIPQLITSDNGCPYPKSTVLMPLGIMYKSNKGIYLLSRSLQVDYIGSPVEDYNSQDITSAELIQDKNQVRFLTSSGVTLVYDYFFKQWSTFTNHEGVDAVIWQGDYHYLRNDGQVYAESTGFLDDTTGIVLKAATAWLKMAGIQGFQRVRGIAFLGDYKSAHQLQIRVGYDYKPAYQDTYTFDATTVIISSANTYQFRQSLKQQKCDSLRIEISDTLPGTPGGSYNMNDISLEVGVKPGINRLKAAQSI